MALTNRIDPAGARERLAAWLRDRMPEAGGVEVHDVEVPSVSGMSAETVMFEAAWQVDGVAHRERLVARVPPAPGTGVFMTSTLAAEARVMSALAQGTDIPVPAVRWHEDTDDSVLGGPFVVMPRIEGRIASDDPPFTAQGWVLDLSPSEQAVMCDNALRTLAAIHAVDHEALGLGWLARPERGTTPLDQELSAWEDVFAWASEGEANPTIEAGFEWVRAHRPSEPEPVVLNWGDARLGNLLIADDLSVAGVLDWEMVGLGSPEQDLGWWLFLLRHHTEGIGMALPPGFPTAAQTVARYEELTGHTVRHLELYEVLAGLRLSILMVRAAHMMIAGGLIGADAPMALSNPASQLLASLAGLPSPEGAAQSFIGNR